MKLLLDFFPIILFFVAFKLQGIYVATAVAIVATLAQMAWVRHRYGRIEASQWLGLGLVVVFGGATLLAHDETFIKWKPTVLYAVMALALWGSWYLAGKNFIRTLMQKQLELPDSVWLNLMHSWAGFFSLMAVLNIYIAYQFDTDTWVNFKLFGGMGMMLLFVLLQALMLGRHLNTPKS